MREGSCRLAVDGQPELMLEADDFVLLPTTPGFTMSGFEPVTPKLFDPYVAALAKSGLPVFPNEAGVWAVCRKCSELVDSEKWPALANHALRQFLKRNSAPRHEVPRLWAQFTEVVRLFAEHMIKEA